jgi:hypothetical protein
VTRLPGSVSGPCFADPHSSWSHGPTASLHQLRRGLLRFVRQLRRLSLLETTSGSIDGAGHRGVAATPPRTAQLVDGMGRLCSATNEANRIVINHVGLEDAAEVMRMRVLAGHGQTPYGPRQAAYDLKELRGEHIVHRTGNTRRYEPLTTGLKAMTALLVLRNKTIKPLLAAARELRPTRPALLCLLKTANC